MAVTHEHSDAPCVPRRGVGVFVFAYLLLGGVFIPVVALLAWNVAFLPLTLIVGTMLATLVGHEWRRAGHPLTPAGIVGLGGILIFVARPLTIRGTGVTSAGGSLDTRTFGSFSQTAATEAMLHVALFLMLFGSLYFVTLSSRSRSNIRPRARFGQGRDPSLPRARFVLFAATAIALVAAATLVHSSGGLSAHIAGLALRSSFLSGRYFLTLGYVPLVAATVLYLLVRRETESTPRRDLLSIVSVTLLIFVAFLTGGRGPLILGVILPLVLVKQTGGRPLRTLQLWGIGGVLVVGAMVMSLLLRENVYDKGNSLLELTSNPVALLSERITSGIEARPFDSLILLNEIAARGQLEYQHGTTYLAVPTWFVPGSLLDRPKGGANAWFTSTHLPRFYFPDRIETSVSAVGEGYLNFGLAGVLLAGAALGAAAGRFTYIGRVDTLGRTYIYCMVTPIFFSFIRGDAFHNLSMAIFVLTVASLAYGFVAHTPSRRHSVAQRDLPRSSGSDEEFPGQRGSRATSSPELHPHSSKKSTALVERGPLRRPADGLHTDTSR